MAEMLLRSPINAVEAETAPRIAKLVRRRAIDSLMRDAKELERRRPGTIGMALVAILVLAHRRLHYDSLIVMAVEFVSCLSLLLLARRSAKPSMTRPTAGAATLLTTSPTTPAKMNMGSVWTIAAIALPWVTNTIAKQLGSGNGLEIVMLTSLGWGGLAIALLSCHLRTLSMSVVSSGFLTLFATFIADSQVALWFSLAWGVLCLWWLVNNHWSRVETAVAVSVQPTRFPRVVFPLCGCAVFLLGASLVAGRIPVLRKLQTELMPTSGGTSGKDSAARRGVGNGDALVAARKHATSFGAVDTDLFLDSEKPSLFDVFSDEFGEPKRKQKRVERTQGLSPQNIKNEPGTVTEGNRSASSSEFGIERELPAERKPVDDLVAESLMFWQGESGTHLAAQRYEHFDGASWSSRHTDAPLSTRAAQATRAIECTVIGKQSWFGPSGISVQNSISPFIDSLPEAIKFTRYRSPTIPTRQGIQLWCIDQVDRQDFFVFSPDECLQMPDREHVPDYTVVRMINSRIDLERLEDLVRNCSPGKSHNVQTNDCLMELNHLAHDYAGDIPRGWQQVQSVISGLRNQFVLDRTSVRALSDSQADSQHSVLHQFLQQRRGPDYLFATAAALMLDHLGYRTRFVAGFYANPKNYVAREGEIAILPSDAHAWLEIDVGHGYWIPLEPTPGYRAPKYSANVWYRLKQYRWTIALWALATTATVACIFLFRALLVEWASWIAYPVLFLLSDRRRVTWLCWLLDIRCQIAGVPRTKGTLLREHLLRFRTTIPDDLCRSLQVYLESADRMWFGGSSCLSKSDQAAVARVWHGLTAKALRRGNQRHSKGQLA